jgi:hypothetical protein
VGAMAPAPVMHAGPGAGGAALALAEECRL